MSNRIDKVAIAGAGGTVGKYIASGLLKAGKQVTAITREASSATIADGITVARVDYDKPASIVAALKDHDALIVALNVMAPKEVELKLIDAAVEAGIHWVLPNEHGYDFVDEAAGAEAIVFPQKKAVQAYIDTKEGLNWIGVQSGFWYEFSLVGGFHRFGFDLEKKEVMLLGDGTTAITTSTWDLVGTAVAKLLSLPVEKEGNGPALVDWKNKHYYFASFTINQNDMFASLQRVLGTKTSDWKVSKVPAKEWYENGSEQFKAGKRFGMAQMLYGRMFFDDQPGRQDLLFGLQNEKLDLPREELDSATKRAVKWYGDGVFKTHYR